MTPITRALAEAARFFGRVARTFAYISAGTERLDDLRADLRLAWDGFNSTRESVEEGLAPVERTLFDACVPPGSRILLVGSGSGRDLIPLARAGHRMTGVEPARRALERCEEFLRELGLEAPLVPDFFEDADIRGPFDAIIFSYFCYGYIPVSARRVAVLRKARGLLAPGGRIFVSYVVTARPHRLLTRLANVAAAITRSDWRLEPGDSISMTFDTGRRPCFLFDHAFTTTELLDEIAAAGLDVVHHRTAADYPCVICAAP